MLDAVTVWHGWEWSPKVDDKTPSGRLLLELTRRMSLEDDLRRTSIVVFGSSPLEFSLLLNVQSGDIDVTPDQFLYHLRNRVSEWKLNTGDPYVQVLPPTVFKAGRNYLLRASAIRVNQIQVILPHPVDLLFRKLHRMDEKDYRSVNALVESVQRPTAKDLCEYMRENPDIFEGASGQISKLAGNIETLHSYLSGEAIDVHEQYIVPSRAERIKEWQEGSGNLAAASDLALDAFSNGKTTLPENKNGGQDQMK